MRHAYFIFSAQESENTGKKGVGSGKIISAEAVDEWIKNCFLDMSGLFINL